MASREGSIEVLMVVALLASIVFVVAVLMGGGVSTEGVNAQIDDIAPYAQSGFLASSLDSFYLEPAAEYSVYRAAYNVTDERFSWAPGTIGTQDEFQQRFQQAAEERFNARTGSLEGEGCSIGGASADIRVEERLGERGGEEGTAINVTGSGSPIRISCEGESSRMEKMVSVDRDHFSAGNRLFYAVNISRAIARSERFNLMAQVNALSPAEREAFLRNYGFAWILYDRELYTAAQFSQELRDPLTPEEQELLFNWIEVRYEGMDGEDPEQERRYMSAREEFGGFEVELEKSGLTAADIDVTDTRYTMPTEEGYRHLSLNVTYDTAG